MAVCFETHGNKDKFWNLWRQVWPMPSPQNYHDGSAGEEHRVESSYWQVRPWGNASGGLHHILGCVPA